MRLPLTVLFLTLLIGCAVWGCRGKFPPEAPSEPGFPPIESAPDISVETAHDAQEENAVSGETLIPDTPVRSAAVTGTRARSLGELSARLPPMGVHIGELNPVNYQNADPAVLRQMGMDQYLVSFLAAEQLYRDGNYQGAITEYSRSIGLNPDYADALEGRGNAWLKTGDTSRAIEDYTRVINRGTSRAEVYNYRGFVYAERGETEKAVEDFSRALNLKPGYADALANRSRALYMMGDYRKAIDDCTRLIALEPENFTAWNRRGSSWYSQQDDTRAIADFSRAISIKPDFALALHNRGNAWHSKGDFAKALADLDNAITIDPGFAAAHSSRDYILRLLDTK